MIYTAEVQHMCPVAKGAYHGPAPIPEEGKWVQAKEIKDISGFTHGVGWCAPQQGACKLSLNIKDGVIEEALVETIGCSGMTHSAAMASEILIGKTILEALNTDLVCDALFVPSRVIGIFTDTTISLSSRLRQRPDHYTIRAGRNLPDKEFRYLRTVIVTAAVYWGFNSSLLLR